MLHIPLHGLVQRSKTEGIHPTQRANLRLAASSLSSIPTRPSRPAPPKYLVQCSPTVVLRLKGLAENSHHPRALLRVECQSRQAVQLPGSRPFLLLIKQEPADLGSRRAKRRGKPPETALSQPSSRGVSSSSPPRVGPTAAYDPIKFHPIDLPPSYLVPRPPSHHNGHVQPCPGLQMIG